MRGVDGDWETGSDVTGARGDKAAPVAEGAGRVVVQFLSLLEGKSVL